MSEKASDFESVKHAAETLLTQCASLVGALRDETFVAESEVLAGGTLGKHVRHTVDHFRAIMDSIGSDEPIDYDHRSRGGDIESCTESCVADIESIRDRIAKSSVDSFAQPVKIRVMVSGDGREAVLDSTLARELAFATHHGVHHQAMMKAIASEMGTGTPSDFGMAPSTVNHVRTNDG